MSDSAPDSARKHHISRRAFVGAGVTGAIAAVVGIDACGSAAVPSATQSVPRAAPPSTQVTQFELEEVTLADLQRGMVSGRYTSRSLCEAYLGRIAELDRQGPMLRAVLQLNPEALAIAAALDSERKTRGTRGPLHGVPVLIKDNIDTHDRMTTAAGSAALANSVAPRDSFVAERLRAAGAVILGKSNLSEWANFRSTHASSGWSGLGGQTRNPYALDRTPSGSSSGSGTAVSANLCAIAVGTETDGSITSPASVASLVGIKPTVGLVSRAGIIPISHSQDTAGPMARTVTDAAILLSALAAVDPRDPATTAGSGRSAVDYTRFLRADGLRGARIGVARKKYFGYSVQADHIAELALDAMRRAGAVVVDPADIATAANLDADEFDVLLYEFKHDLNAYLASLGPTARMKSLHDLIAYNSAHAAEEMPYFGQEIFTMAEAKGPLTEKKYLSALRTGHVRSRAGGIDATMTKYRLDAIVAPTQGPPGLIDLVNGDAGGGSVTSPAAIAGYPHITVPAGYAFGLPVGMSFFGRAWSEPTLITLAYAFEQATRARRAPRLLPTALLT
ncbi:MAG: amidase [Gemmatimonadaceae bacterium]